MEATKQRRPIPIRRQRHDLSGVPSDWFGGTRLGSAITDGVNLLFPHGERFFVRSVRAFEDRIQDPTLKAQLRGFYGQEGNHAREHERYFTYLKARGHDIDGFLEVFERNLRWLEGNVPPEWNLAATAAAEHYTAIMADHGISHGSLEEADPRMRDFLLWHAVEELEHREVAFDVLQEVDPRYRTRIIGLVFATLMLSSHWLAAVRLLTKQQSIGLREVISEFKAIRQAQEEQGRGPKKRILKDVFLKGIATYLKRDFHPSEHGDDEALERYIASRPDLVATA